jgi:sulfur carrier protein
LLARTIPINEASGETMNVVINGQREDLKVENIDDLVNRLGLVREAVLVEHNGTALLRSEWPHTQLASGDQIEILRVAAGG